MPDLNGLQIAQRAFNTPLMLDPAKASVIAQQLGPRFLGQAGSTQVTVDGWTGETGERHRQPRAATLLGDEIHQYARRRQTYSVVGGVAIIPIIGTLVRRGSYIGESSGVTSYEGISAQLRAAAEDDAVRVIALEIDSFGGEAHGCFALAAEIRSARAVKPVEAFLAEFAPNPQHRYLLRLVDPPKAPLPLPQTEVIVDRGPFSEASDRALMEAHHIDLIVSKNAGGTGAYAKIAAARALKLPVLMIDRPPQPHRLELATPADVLDWVHETNLGV